MSTPQASSTPGPRLYIRPQSSGRQKNGLRGDGLEDVISAETREILSGCDALLEGHFRYTSGRHGSVYFEKIRVAQHPGLVMRLAELMERRLEGLGEDVDMVCAPAFGALVFGFA